MTDRSKFGLLLLCLVTFVAGIAVEKLHALPDQAVLKAASARADLARLIALEQLADCGGYSTTFPLSCEAEAKAYGAARDASEEAFRVLSGDPFIGCLAGWVRNGEACYRVIIPTYQDLDHVSTCLPLSFGSGYYFCSQPVMKREKL